MALVTYHEKEPGLGVITLNDPDNLNAMGEEMAAEFKTLIQDLPKRKSLPRIIALTGAGRAFSAGGKLEMLEKKKTLSPEENKKRMLDFYHSFLCIRNLPAFTVAAINGHAIGAGLCLACACDMRVAVPGARLGVTFVRLGLHPGMGGTYFLPKILGNSVATELLVSGRVLEAEQAKSLGLIAQVTSAETLFNPVTELLTELRGTGPLVTAQLLRTLRGSDAELEAALEREALCQSVNYAGAEFAEGVRAAIEKRVAKF